MTTLLSLPTNCKACNEGKQEFIDSLNEYDLLIIDDLGN